MSTPEGVGKLAKHQQKGAGNFLEFRKFGLPIFGRYFKVLWTVFSIQFQYKKSHFDRAREHQ